MSDHLDALPAFEDDPADLNALLSTRGGKQRSKFTSALIVVLVLLIGVFLGVLLGRASAELGQPAPGQSTEVVEPSTGPAT